MKIEGVARLTTVSGTASLSLDSTSAVAELIHHRTAIGCQECITFSTLADAGTTFAIVDFGNVSACGFFAGGSPQIEAKAYFDWAPVGAVYAFLATSAGATSSAPCLASLNTSASGTASGTLTVSAAASVYFTTELHVDVKSGCGDNFNDDDACYGAARSIRSLASGSGLQRIIVEQPVPGANPVRRHISLVDGNWHAGPGVSLVQGQNTGDDPGELKQTVEAIFNSTSASYAVGVHSMSLAPVAYLIRDAQFDFNQDGRFDAADRDGLQELIDNAPSNMILAYDDPALVSRLNVAESGNEPTSPFQQVLDQADIDYISNLLSLNLGTPPLGDFDQDGCVTCADAIHSPSVIASTFDDVQASDPLYLLELDSNLDGKLDSTDRLAFYAAVNHSDFNNDGLVDDADFLIFGVHYDNLAAEGDQNGDGATDDADFLIFVVHYNELVCPSCN